MSNKIKHMRQAVKLAEQPIEALSNAILNIESQIRDVNREMYGDGLKTKLDMGQKPSPVDRMGAIGYEQKYSTAAPTKTHQDSYAIAKEEFIPIQNQVKTLYEVDIKKLEEQLKLAGAPYTPGRVLENEGVE